MYPWLRAGMRTVIDTGSSFTVTHPAIGVIPREKSLFARVQSRATSSPLALVSGGGKARTAATASSSNAPITVIAVVIDYLY
jgi:hypothetical protein